jgi:hypothetical protein
MPYVINKTNRAPLLTLDDGVVDTSTSVGLIGRNYVGYGETQNENFIHLMENFANTNPPPRPIQGQNWFDTQNNLLKVYDGQNWSVVGSAILAENQPEGAVSGALWLKLPGNILYVYDGDNWQLIGPENAEGFGVTKSRSMVLLDSENNLNPVILLLVNDEVISIVSQKEFLISNQNPVNGFVRLFPGINLNSSVKIYGDLQGLSQRASRLNSTRTINGVGFNGEFDIVIKSSTEKKLKRGTYLTGSDFDGSSEITWTVDASPENIIGKVVARDSSGSFSATSIKSDLIGNVQGNVNSTSGTSNFNIVTANQFVGANLSGNARTATRLQFDRKINDVVFNGTQDITIPASAQTLTGNSLNPSVVLSNLNQVGILNSLSITDLGITLGNGGQLRISMADQQPTISTTGSNTPLRIRISDTQFSGFAGIDIIPASLSLGGGGENVTSIIPSSALNIGHPSHVINKIYANNFVGNVNGQADTSSVSERSNNLSGGGSGFIPYQTAANQTAFLPAGQAGQVLRSGGTGEPTWGSISFSTLERGNYLIGSNYDGIISTAWSVDATPDNNADKLVARDSNGNFSAGTITANLVGNVTGNSETSSRLLTARTINGVLFDGTSNIVIQAEDSNKVSKSGDTVTGNLNLIQLPTQPNHATNKLYVDSRLPQFTFITGNTVLSTSGFTNQVGSFDDNSNYFDVFPPTGKNMANLVAFIPSIAIIHFAGGVDSNDSLRCTWQALGDRIRVWVQNTEQRSTPGANYLAIWS